METLKQKLYKVIATSNFNDQSVSDLLIKDNLTKEMADRIVKDHNDDMHQYSYVIYQTVDQDYKLHNLLDVF